ncbi:MAG: acyltransferase, partial [Candidatus Omnitrophica bacterium]|nr:acyltransferase [Candidatus Omnitrophota bacterium]
TLPFLKYRLSKFLVPLLFWSFIYCLQSCREQHLPVTPVNVFRMILAGPAYYHLWFLYTLAALYCLIPVFRIFIRHAKPEMIWYALALWFLMASLLPFCLRIFYKFTGEHINWQPLVVLRGPAGYLIGGYILGRLKPSKRTALFCFGIYLLTAGLVAFGTMRLSLLQENYDGFLNDPVSSGMVVLSFSFFISAKYWGDSLTKKSLWLKIAQRVSPLTLGVFLIHPLLISYLFKKNAVTSFNFIYDPVFRITLKVVLVFTLSALCVWLISKVPVLKKTVSPAQR